MSTYKLNNISIKEYRKFLTKCNCVQVRISGGHEIWTAQGLSRPIVFQTHIDPIPEFILKQILRALNIDKKRFFEILRN